MTDRQRKYLSDVIYSAELIISFQIGISYEDYQIDIKTKSAIERQLAVIGEALTKLQKESPVEIKHSSQIISLRNRLVHAYDSIEDSIIWAIIQNHIKPLLVEATSLLNEKP